MLSTLVIHPKDLITDFLSEIYLDRGWTIINVNISKSRLKSEIKSHDRIIMLGHGTEYGLLGFGRFIIDSTLVYLLRDKVTICIWCNADVFVKKYGLRGFYTGMIISELEEAIMYCIDVDTNSILESNICLSSAVSESIDSVDMLDSVKRLYGGNSAVIEFNRGNLYYKDK